MCAAPTPPNRKRQTPTANAQQHTNSKHRPHDVKLLIHQPSSLILNSPSLAECAIAYICKSIHNSQSSFHNPPNRALSTTIRQIHHNPPQSAKSIIQSIFPSSHLPIMPSSHYPTFIHIYPQRGKRGSIPYISFNIICIIFSKCYRNHYVIPHTISYCDIDATFCY